MTDPVVRLQGVSKRYDDRQVLRGLDLTVGRGEVLALLGPNGAGKTTTVEILEGLRRPDAGEVVVLGEVPWAASPAWRDRIGVVLQETSDGADLCVREALAHHRRYYARPRGVAEILAVMGLAGQAGQRVGTLSGGQRRRLDVALALIGDPELVFLDEPTTGFDPAARRELWQLVLGMRDQGTTVLLTTHDLQEAEVLSDRVAVLVDGTLVAEGTARELASRLGRPATVSWIDDDGSHCVATPVPEREVAAIQASGGPIRDLTVSRPDLEEAYLDLIGKQATA